MLLLVYPELLRDVKNPFDFQNRHFLGIIKGMDIIKASGEREKFSEKKLFESLRNSGASKTVAEKVQQTVLAKIEKISTTDQLAKSVLKQLRREDLRAAARYRLKGGMIDLGPTGFLFERYMARVLHEYGYSALTNQFVQGYCLEHEVDIMASKGDTRYIVEAKYHNTLGVKTNSQITMYAHARLLDIKAAEAEKKNRKFDKHTMWLITNTKFTDRAIAYASCRGIKLTGWNYPEGESLQELIEEKMLHPITILPSVDPMTREKLAKFNILLAKDVLDHEPFLLAKRLDGAVHKARMIVSEANKLLR
jgi:Holliday junction resolvase-like predicted endonuclease